MTKDIEDMIKYPVIWENYKEGEKELKCERAINLNKSKAQESWENFKAMMREEYGEDFI